MGLGEAVNHRTIHTLTWFRDNLGCAPEDHPDALAFGRGALSLPCHTGLEQTQAETVASAVRAFPEG